MRPKQPLGKFLGRAGAPSSPVGLPSLGRSRSHLPPGVVTCPRPARKKRATPGIFEKGASPWQRHVTPGRRLGKRAHSPCRGKPGSAPDGSGRFQSASGAIQQRKVQRLRPLSGAVRPDSEGFLRCGRSRKEKAYGDKGRVTQVQVTNGRPQSKVAAEPNRERCDRTITAVFTVPLRSLRHFSSCFEDQVSFSLLSGTPCGEHKGQSRNKQGFETGGTLRQTFQPQIFYAHKRQREKKRSSYISCASFSINIESRPALVSLWIGGCLGGDACNDTRFLRVLSHRHILNL